MRGQCGAMASCQKASMACASRSRPWAGSWYSSMAQPVSEPGASAAMRSRSVRRGRTCLNHGRCRGRPAGVRSAWMPAETSLSGEYANLMEVRS